MTAPRVSIVMVTYNHEAFLREAIESVLEQDFDAWELVIGEDCSTDGTLAIAREYAAAHPEKIRLLETSQNLGRRANYLRTLAACQSEFVAQLDGDDYWTDEEKLGLQVAFLDANPDCSMVFCACEDVFDNPAQSRHINYPRGRKPRYTQEDLIARNITGASSAVLWRRPDIEGLPKWFVDVPVGDWPLHTLVADNGPIGYIDRVLCVHRNHDSGVWGGMTKIAQLEQRIETRRFIQSHLGDTALPTARVADLNDRYLIAKALANKGEPERAAKEYLWCYRNRIRGHRPHFLRSLWGWGRARLRQRAQG